MISIIDCNIAVHIVICVGICIGVIGGLSTSFKELTEKEPLCYSGVWTQFFNRALFVIACFLCLFAKFPALQENPLSMFNWFCFPILGFFIFCLFWVVTFWAMIALKAVLRWVFSSIIDQLH